MVNRLRRDPLKVQCLVRLQVGSPSERSAPSGAFFLPAFVYLLEDWLNLEE